MVLTLNIYDPKMAVDDTPPGGLQHPAGKGSIKFACRILTRYGEVVIDFDEFDDLLGYSDSLSVEGAASQWAIRMKATLCNEDLLKKVHPGYLIEVYAARNADPLIGVVRDPTTIQRVDTTPDLSVIPSAPPVSATPTDGANASPPSPGGALPQGLDANAQLIVDECIRQGVTNPQHIAYILGTAQHESDQFNTLEEYASGAAYEGNVDSLGNTQSGDGRRYKGRGYVQLTGRRNYTEYSRITGRDLVGNPRLVQEDANLAAFILVHGMRTGTFTGRSLSRYTDANGNLDFTRARAIVNGGGDRASRIAGYARQWQQQLPRFLSGSAQQIARPAAVTPVAVQTQQTVRYQTPLAVQRYGVPRSGGRRRHAGVDWDIPNDNSPTAISFIGGVVTRVERFGNPPQYGNTIDIWNANLGVVERIAEFKTRSVTQVGVTVLPGQAVGRGEDGSGVFHYEIRSSGLEDVNGNKRGGFGFEGTTDPVAYLRSLGIDPYATPDKVFQNARIQPPSGGLPSVAAGSAPVAVAAVDIEGPVVEPVEDYYLDKCPHLLLHGIITDYGRASDNATVLTISGEGYGKVYKDAFVLLDHNSPTTLGRAFDVRTQALVATAVSLIYYQLLRNWVESFWGETTGWEARTRVIPLPPNYCARIAEGSVWSALQYLSIDGFFHLFVDHTGALTWEKLPWSAQENALVAGRYWEGLPKIDCPSWKILNWNDRLSEQGIMNFVRIIPTMQGTSGGQEATGLAGMVYNMGSIRQYGGPTKREIAAPTGISTDQWYTSLARGEAQATINSFADLCVLEAIRWYDRPVQRCNITARGESAWRIGTRIELAENWHCPNAKPGQYYVTSRAHQIDIQSGSWKTSLSLVRDRRARYLGIGVGEVPIIQAAQPSNDTALQSQQFTGTAENFRFDGARQAAASAPTNEAGDTSIIEQSYLQVPLVPDEYFWFDRSQNQVIPIGNDPIKFALESIIPRMGQVEATPVAAPTTPTDRPDPNKGGETEQAEVAAPQLENDSPPGSYNLSLRRNGEVLTEVPSPINGTVVRATRQDDYGNVVEIRGSDGRSWLIAHLDSRGVTVGQRVTRGQPVGNQGSTGNSTAPHILVEIRRVGRNGRSEVVGDRAVTRPLISQYIEFVSTGRNTQSR